MRVQVPPRSLGSNMKQPTQMKHFLPLLHAAMNVHNSTEEDQNNAEDADFWATEALLSLEEVDEIWESNLEQYWDWVQKEAPQVCRDFYDKLGSLHDYGYEIVVNGNEYTIKFTTYETISRDYCTIKFKCDNVFHEQTVPDWFASEDKSLLYDEFHMTDGKLSYHFSSSDGTEWAFYDIMDLTWEKLLGERNV